MIPYNLEEVDVPDDLKKEVMQAIFFSEEEDKPASKWKWPERLTFLGLPSYIWITAALTVALVGALWNNVIMRQQLLALEQQSQLPSQVLQAYSLKSADPSLVSAKGNVWLFEQGNAKKLVFHLEGLEATKGTETYQVWLIQSGKRRSAGVFRVDKQGNGVLTYEMKEEQLPFEAIGITLEPDADGTQPRGKKVLGT
ncbi:anti-sigma factor [Ammoniphilus sp. 3BR4]|uniref:anti-sigma factor n=1 Tax=Ammoniphilus sp. 3BR4 TaxID=3158265 RepID=UPI00346543C0